MKLLKPPPPSAIVAAGPISGWLRILVTAGTSGWLRILVMAIRPAASPLQSWL